MMNTIQFSVLVVLLATLNTDVVFCCCRCQCGWYEFENNCYFFSTELKTWEEAKAYCSSVKASLVSVETEKENHFLKSHCMRLNPVCTTCPEKKYQHFMTSGNDLTTEGTFKWESGTAFNFTDWGAGEPNNQGGHENCMGFANLLNYKWNDDVCSNAHRFICEKVIV